MVIITNTLSFASLSKDCTVHVYDNQATEIEVLHGPPGGYFSVAAVYQRDRCGAVLLAGTFKTVQLWAPKVINYYHIWTVFLK